MSNALAAVVNFFGGPLGILPGAVLGIDTGVIGNALGLGPKKEQPDTAATVIRIARPPRVSAYGESRLYGACILYETSSNGTAVDVYAVHDGRIEQVTRHYLNDDRVTVVGDVVQPGEDGRYGDLTPPKVRLYTTNGSSPGAPFTAIASLLPGIWTSAHRGDGVVLLGQTCHPVKAADFTDVYPSGAPTPSIAAKWQRCPDPSAADPTDEAGWTWTENPIRQLLHYKLVREGVDFATKIQPAIASWIAATAVCNEAVPLKGGGTEPRWRSCVSHKHTDPHKDVVAKLLGTCDGWISTRADGAFVVHAGKFTTPTVSIGPAEIVGYDWEGVGVDDDTAINEIVVSYVSAEHEFTMPETDPWTDEDDILERGKVLSTTLAEQVPSHGQARRLAKRLMARTNALRRGSVTTNRAGKIARGQRYINLRIEEAGAVFFNGVAEITGVTRNAGSGGITFSWIEADPNIDAWNPATEEGEPAALGDRVPLETLETPTIGSATPSVYEFGAQIAIDGLGPIRDDLTWYVRWKVSTDVSWIEQSATDTDPGSPVALMTPIVPIDQSIDVAIAYGTGDGRTSQWSLTETVTTSSSGLAPSPTTDTTATGGAGQITVDWRNPGSSNYDYTRSYRGTTNVFSAATAMTPDDAGGALAFRTQTFTGIPAGTYYVWTRAFSAAGVGAAPTLAPGTVTVT